MKGEVVELADVVLEKADDWRHRATLFAMVNPIGFFVVMGCTLPEYLRRVDEMERTWRAVKEKSA